MPPRTYSGRIHNGTFRSNPTDQPPRVSSSQLAANRQITDAGAPPPRLKADGNLHRLLDLEENDCRYELGNLGHPDCYCANKFGAIGRKIRMCDYHRGRMTRAPTDTEKADVKRRY